MADDKDERGAQDRTRVAGDQDYEVRHLMERHRITRERALELIKEHGPSREAIEKAIKG